MQGFNSNAYSSVPTNNIAVLLQCYVLYANYLSNENQLRVKWP